MTPAELRAWIVTASDEDLNSKLLEIAADHLYDDRPHGAIIMAQTLLNAGATPIYGPWPPTPLGKFLTSQVPRASPGRPTPLVRIAQKSHYPAEELQELQRIARTIGVREYPVDRLALRIINKLLQR